MLVVDASVLAPALGDDGPHGDAARARLRGHDLLAPELIDLEVTSVSRRPVRGGRRDLRGAAMALTDLVELPLTRVPHRRLIERCWALRANLTVYDAAYVTLAELLGLVLVTADLRLSRTPQVWCQIDVLG